MPTLPWKTLHDTDEDKTYTVMLTYLPLRRYRDTVRFMKYANEIIAQLQQTEGIVGYSFKAHLFGKDYWTVSVWEDEKAISKYIQTKPHADIMTNMQGAMGKTAFATWEVKAAEIPVIWSDALSHLVNG